MGYTAIRAMGVGLPRWRGWGLVLAVVACLSWQAAWTGVQAGSVPARLEAGQFTPEKAKVVLGQGDDEGRCFEGPLGGPFVPASAAFTLANEGDQVLSWAAAAEDGTWLDVAPVSGALDPGESLDVAITVTAGGNVLAGGTYADTLRCTDLLTLESQTRSVTLYVADSITSRSHPGPHHWYADTTFDAEWPGYYPEAAGYLWLIDDAASTVLDANAHYTEDNFVTEPGLGHGVRHFHLAAADEFGEVIPDSQAAYRFNVIADPPRVTSPSHPDNLAGTIETDFEAHVRIAGPGGSSGEWSQATVNAPWPGRSGHTSVVFDNKMWVMGGTSRGFDVWYSEDGVNWTQAASNAIWGSRYSHSSVVFDNKM